MKGRGEIVEYIGLFLKREDRGLSQFMISSDKGGRGVWTRPYLAHIKCEQPLMQRQYIQDFVFNAMAVDKLLCFFFRITFKFS